MAFKDYFSKHAAVHAETRPDYPEALFDFLGTQCSHHDLAWDCATGNGQAALALAKIFTRVIASDGSAQQIQQAQPAANIEYRQVTAEEAFLDEGSVDLVTVAQALHWFDTDAFFRNVLACLKPDGVFAAFSYGVHSINEPIDGVVGRLYEDILGDYWPPQRRLVENHYRDISFPFDTAVEEGLIMEREWNLAQLCGYLNSWSALQRYARQNGANPLGLVQGELLQAWGPDPEKRYRVEWPLTVIVGKP